MSVNPASRWTTPLGCRILGVVMIARDEAPRLPALFMDLAELADEVVVVDTGSTDGTRDVCREWGVTLVEHPWRDDFSDARNRAIESATARHLLWLDGDDRLPADSARKLADLRDGPLAAGDPRAIELIVHNLDAAGARIDSFRQVRVFPNDPRIRYRGSVHESFMDSLRSVGVPVEPLAAEVLHTGYATPASRGAKAERNARLLRRAAGEHPGDLHHGVHLAQALAGMGDVAGAARAMDGVIALAEGVDGSEAIRAELLVARGRHRQAAGDAAGAADDLRAAHRLRPGWGVAAVLLAERCALDGDWQAVEALVDGGAALEFSPGALGHPLARLEASYHRLRGRLRLDRGDAPGAIACLERALSLHPAGAEARLELGQALLDTGDFRRAHDTLRPLAEDEAAIPRLFELLAALGLASAGAGDLDGAGACLAPLVEFLAELLPATDGATPLELAAALEGIGQGAAARNLVALDALLAAGASCSQPSAPSSAQGIDHG